MQVVLQAKGEAALVISGSEKRVSEIFFWCWQFSAWFRRLGSARARAFVGFKNGCRRRARARGPNARKTVASWNLLTQSGKLPSCAVCICSVFISNDVIEICSVFISNDVIEFCSVFISNDVIEMDLD